MSYRVGTPNYNLPQTEGTDKRDWSDTNQAFANLDAALHGAVSDAGTALTASQTAQTAADGAVTTAQGAVTTANSASATAASANETAQLANTAAQAAQATASSAETTAQGAVTTANAASATASNADTVALAAQAAVGALSQLTTTDKSSAVAAINEVNEKVTYTPFSITGDGTKTRKQGLAELKALITAAGLTLRNSSYMKMGAAPNQNIAYRQAFGIFTYTQLDATNCIIITFDLENEVSFSRDLVTGITTDGTNLPIATGSVWTIYV